MWHRLEAEPYSVRVVVSAPSNQYLCKLVLAFQHKFTSLHKPRFQFRLFFMQVSYPPFKSRLKDAIRNENDIFSLKN